MIFLQVRWLLALSHLPEESKTLYFSRFIQEDTKEHLKNCRPRVHDSTVRKTLGKKGIHGKVLRQKPLVTKITQRFFPYSQVNILMMNHNFNHYQNTSLIPKLIIMLSTKKSWMFWLWSSSALQLCRKTMVRNIPANPSLYVSVNRCILKTFGETLSTRTKK